MRPDVIRDNALTQVRRIEGALAASPGGEREKLLSALSERLHVAGIATLLATADASGFRRHLVRAGEVRRELLRPLARGGAPSWHQRSSLLTPFVDALVGGADAVAAEIARLSPRDWMEDEEFEEEFWYARFLYGLVLGAGPDAEQALVELRRASGDGAARPDLCAALLARDAGAFATAFESLHAERDAEIREAEEGLVRDRERHHADKYVFVEGLALLWLAQPAGLTLDPPAAMLPVLARRPAAG